MKARLMRSGAKWRSPSEGGFPEWQAARDPPHQRPAHAARERYEEFGYDGCSTGGEGSLPDVLR